MRLPPLQFRPWLSGRYTVAPGLSKLEGPAFLFDEATPDYLAEKQRVLSEKPELHLAYHDFGRSLEEAVTKGMVTHLRGQVPDELMSAEMAGALDAPTVTAGMFDRLARLIPEDVAVLALGPDGRDALAALHISFPNGWDPREKIGQSFFATHAPVPQIEPVNARASHFARLMTSSPTPLVRFVWGLRFDAFLDHHPQSPERAFDPSAPVVVVRVERQTMIPLPAVSAAVFLIRTYLYPAASLTPHERSALRAAIDGMSEASALYKGVANHRAAIVASLSG